MKRSRIRLRPPPRCPSRAASILLRRTATAAPPARGDSATAFSTAASPDSRYPDLMRLAHTGSCRSSLPGGQFPPGLRPPGVCASCAGLIPGSHSASVCSQRNGRHGHAQRPLGGANCAVIRACRLAADSAFLSTHACAPSAAVAAVSSTELSDDMTRTRSCWGPSNGSNSTF